MTKMINKIRNKFDILYLYQKNTIYLFYFINNRNKINLLAKRKNAMIKIIIILILISFSLKLNKCIKHTDFCFLKELKIKCEGVYNLTCGNVVCTKYEDSCRSLTLISSLKNIQKNQKYDGHHMKKFKSFLSLIKDCPKLTEWMPVNVCLNSKNCLKPFIRNIRLKINKVNVNAVENTALDVILIIVVETNRRVMI